jgi:hypothetical protein
MATPRALSPLALLLVLGFCVPSRAAEGPDKDHKKALKLVEDNAAFQKLPSQSEKDAVVDQIVYDQSQLDEDLDRASVRVLKGDTLENIDAQRTGFLKKCDPVISQEHCVENKSPVKYKWVSKEMPLPPMGELFPDNDWLIQTSSPDAQGLLTGMQKILKFLDDRKGPKGEITRIHIEASASTIRNTGKSKNKTHEELSKLRADAAAAFIKEQLGARAPAPANITKGWLGQNENGTSGPSSPYKCPDGVDKKFCPKGKGSPPSTDEMLDYLKSQDAEGGAIASPGQVLEGRPEPADVEGGGPPSHAMSPEQKAAFRNKYNLGSTPDKAPPASGGSCQAPRPVDKWDLYPAYYYQFKYVDVTFTVSVPTPIPDDSVAATKDCTARMVLVCVDTKHEEPHHRRPPHPPKYRLRRLGHFLRCLFTPKGPCPSFDCL